MERVLLSLHNVSKRFLGIAAVDSVSFTVPTGEITGYLGPNGSGKSTTMKMITGLMETTSGEIRFDGEPIANEPDAYKRRFGYVPEEPYIYTHLSGFEYLTMVGQLRALPQRETRPKIDETLRLFGLWADRQTPISAYSKGMRQKILLSAALLHNPDLILLDEPFSGLDVGTGLVFRSSMQGLAARGKAILFSSHELETVERVCSRVIILHRGKVAADDSVAHLRKRLSANSLEAVFSQLAVENDPAEIARGIVDVVTS